jgi:hypothetical protein
VRRWSGEYSDAASIVELLQLLAEPVVSKIARFAWPNVARSDEGVSVKSTTRIRGGNIKGDTGGRNTIDLVGSPGFILPVCECVCACVPDYACVPWYLSGRLAEDV